jgi:hypothetical protein
VACVLAALALAGLLLKDGSLPHLHVDEGPGFFNHDHDLVLLAGLAGGGTGPGALPALGLIILILLRPAHLAPSPATVSCRRPDVRGPPKR